MYHTPVLLDETMALLITGEGLYIDATLGGGGHSEKILEILSTNGWQKNSRLIGFDRDREAIQTAKERLKTWSMFQAIELKFSEMSRFVNEQEVAGILLDLGISSHQIDEGARGFSFQKSAKLDMRMSQSDTKSAHDIINQYAEKDIASILWKYGEEKKSRTIAKRIVEHRKIKSIETTEELAAIIRTCFPANEHIKALARAFQAIRIEVNNELEELKTALTSAMGLLKRGGRIAVMSYHSLEDRIVKDFFRDHAHDDWGFDKGLKGIPMKMPLRPATMKIITKKPIEASESEILKNSRARSAKLRVAEKL